MTSTPLISDSACNLVVKKKLWDGLIYIYIFENLKYHTL